MQLILRADVENLGRLGEVVTVKPGYGRNYLVPQGLAMAASEANLKVFERERKKLQARMDSARAAAQDVADKLAGLALTIEVRVGENDKLYGSVTSAQIADLLAASGVEIDRKKIVLDEPIRSLGDYVVEVKLHPDVRGKVAVAVVRQGGQEEPQAPEAAEASGTAEEEAAS
ncbi:MAG: 50S ribosomal protein L9 [Desulfovibrio sp.]|nr:50S ribosomal protein L9 [Desulfovibrio sp.]